MSNQPDIAVDLRTIKGKLHFSIRTGLIDADDVNSLIQWLETIASLDDHPGRKPTIAAVPLTVPWVDPVHEYDRWAKSRKRDQDRYLWSSNLPQPVDTAGTVSRDSGTASSDTVSSG